MHCHVISRQINSSIEITEHSHPSYWRRYRRVRSNVDEHLTSIYSDQSQIENDEITEDLRNSNDSVSPGQGPCVEECSESLNPVQLHVDLQQPSDQRIEEIHENVNLLDEHSDASIDLDSDTGDIVVAADAGDFFDAQSNASDTSECTTELLEIKIFLGGPGWLGGRELRVVRAT